MSKAILLGYEVGTGEPVYVDPDNLIITGQTRMAGKTVTLNALNSRSGLRSIAFRTKRGEMSFDASNSLKPFYREPKTQRSKYISWQYIKSLFEASQGRGMNFEEAWIIRACDRAKTLRDVYENVKRLQKESRKGIDENQYLKLSAYFDIILPQLEEREYSTTLKLKKGINVMDLEPLTFEMRCLVMERTITYVMEHMKNVIIMLPEGWNYVPETRTTPVKASAILLAREGGAIGNQIWIDSMPHYETLLCRIDGFVHATTFGSLFTLEPSSSNVTDKGEKMKYFESVVEVPVHNGIRLTWGRVKYVLEHDYDGDILRLNTVSGVIDVSPNHPVMKHRGIIVEASTLEVGERLVQRKFPPNRFKNSGNRLLFIGTEELAWTYGFYGAEGWVNGKHTCVSNSDHSKIMRAYNAIKTNFHYSPSISEREGIYTLDVGSPVLNQHLRDFMYLPSMDPSSRTKRVPPPILNSRDNIQRAFINGYESGDGHYNKERGYLQNISSVSRALLLGLQYMKRSPISVYVRHDKPDDVHIKFNKTSGRRKPRSQLKKIVSMPYKGKLYDLEVESKDHTFYMGLGNFRVHNSQDLRGVSKVLVGQCATWILGVQVEENEAKRTRTSLGNRVKVRDIQSLKLGHFYLRNKKNELIHVYVLPANVPEEMGKKVALGELTPEDVKNYLMSQKGDDEEMYRAENESLKLDVKNLRSSLKAKTDKLELLLSTKGTPDTVGLSLDLETARKQITDLEADYQGLIADNNGLKDSYKSLKTELDEFTIDTDTVVQELADLKEKFLRFEQLDTALKAYLERLFPTVSTASPPPSTMEPVEIDLTHEAPILNVTILRKKLTATTSNARGKILYLYSQGELGNETFNITFVNNALKRHGWNQSPRTKQYLDEMTSWGFLSRVPRGKRYDYQVIISPEEAMEKGLLSVSEEIT